MARWNYFRLLVCLSPETCIGLATAAAAPPMVSHVSSPPREKLPFPEIYISGGGLLVASINAPHLLPVNTDWLLTL